MIETTTLQRDISRKWGICGEEKKQVAVIVENEESPTSSYPLPNLWLRVEILCNVNFENNGRNWFCPEATETHKGEFRSLYPRTHFQIPLEVAKEKKSKMRAWCEYFQIATNFSTLVESSLLQAFFPKIVEQ